MWNNGRNLSCRNFWDFLKHLIFVEFKPRSRIRELRAKSNKFDGVMIEKYVQRIFAKM